MGRLLATIGLMKKLEKTARLCVNFRVVGIIQEAVVAISIADPVSQSLNVDDTLARVVAKGLFDKFPQLFQCRLPAFRQFGEIQLLQLLANNDCHGVEIHIIEEDFDSAVNCVRLDM